MTHDSTIRQEQARAARDLAVEQILRSPTRKKVVVAGPGTGKTFLFKSLLAHSSKALTLSFVNTLVEELSLELKGLSDVRTLHSFACSLLSSLRKKDIRIFAKLPRVIERDALVLNGETVEFDIIFRNRDDTNPLIEFYKQRKNYYGNYYGYSDVVFAVTKFLENNPGRIPEFDQIVVDEFQDFNKLEVSLIDLLGRGSPILLVGDDDQALYGFKDASPDHIRRRHSGAEPGYKSFNLRFCSRSTRVIVGAVNDVVVGAQARGLLRERVNKPFEYFEDEEKDKVCDRHPTLTHGAVYSSGLAWQIESDICKLALDLKKRFSVLIISPTGTQVRKLNEALRKKGFRSLDFADRDSAEDPTLLDGLKLLRDDKNSNLGWRICAEHILSAGELAAALKKCGNNELDKICNFLKARHPAAAKVVRRMLAALRKAESDGVLNEECTKTLSEVGFDHSAIMRQAVRHELQPFEKIDMAVRNIPIKLTTIQSSKGLAADYVFITHFDDRYFVRNQDKTCITDHDVCSFLVALTRARNKVFLYSTSGSKPIFLTWIKESRIDTLAGGPHLARE
jgi:superfamily I DNA/RNA helicase